MEVTMEETTQMFIVTGIMLIAALLVGIFILMFATAWVNRHTAKTTVECPMSSCKYCKNDMCMLKDIRFQLLINGYDHEGMFCAQYKQRHIDEKG
jgi:hypothetical protein